MKSREGLLGCGAAGKWRGENLTHAEGKIASGTHAAVNTNGVLASQNSVVTFALKPPKIYCSSPFATAALLHNGPGAQILHGRQPRGIRLD